MKKVHVVRAGMVVVAVALGAVVPTVYALTQAGTGQVSGTSVLATDDQPTRPKGG